MNTDAFYTVTYPVAIPESTRIPLLTISYVTDSLLKLKRTVSALDAIPYWIYEQFAYDLAPLDPVFNCSWRNHTVLQEQDFNLWNKVASWLSHLVY